MSVGNLSNCEQIVELSVDATNLSYKKEQIKEKFDNPCLPFSLETDNENKGSMLVNSEVKHEAWYIENPVSKELTKRITLKLGPKAEQDFIIVVRAPNSKTPENMLAMINIGLLTYADEKFGVSESFEEFLKKKFKGSMKDFLKDRKKVTQVQKLDILLAGQVQIPKMICMKTIKPAVTELESSQLTENQLIPLAIKNISGQQKFRIPFKNTGEHDIEVEFSFHKASQAVNQPALMRSNSSGIPDGKS